MPLRSSGMWLPVTISRESRGQRHAAPARAWAHNRRTPARRRHRGWPARRRPECAGTGPQIARQRHRPARIFAHLAQIRKEALRVAIAHRSVIALTSPRAPLVPKATPDWSISVSTVRVMVSFSAGGAPVPAPLVPSLPTPHKHPYRRRRVPIWSRLVAGALHRARPLLGSAPDRRR
jgi:hypothetical protein